MQYLGGKTRVVKHFAPILREALREKDGKLMEPFVGGFNIVPAVYDDVTSAMCVDLHRGLITLLKAVQDGWEPPESLAHEEYLALKECNDQDDPLTAFAGFGCSFGAKWFGTYARSSKGADDPVKYARAAQRSLLRKREFMDRVEFLCADYHDLHPNNCVVYADPPYAGVMQYAINRDAPFDHDEFWAWCHEAAQNGCRVLVSEFTPPSNGVPFRIRWEKERKVMVNSQTGQRPTVTEKLIEVLS